jgi:hypothetical protein
MKVFNGRSATDEYMSTHSLTFSTPEMTLKKFALWLGDQVTNPSDSTKGPRLLLYIEDISNNDEEELAEILPNVDDSFKPSGAVTDMYGIQPALKITQEEQPSHSVSMSSNNNPSRQNLEKSSDRSEQKYCIECGTSMGINAKFCIRCGNKQN